MFQVERKEVLEEAASLILGGIQSKYLKSMHKNNHLTTSDSKYVLNVSSIYWFHIDVNNMLVIYIE